MPVEPILSGISARRLTIRTGLDIGFADATPATRLRERFRGLWMTVTNGDPNAFAALPEGTVHRFGKECALPFDGNQFDVAVLNGAIISQPLVREIHRVLKPEGYLFFSIEEVVRRGPDCTLSKLYNAILKNGYDIVSVARPPWWHFGRDGKILTLTARKKNWREQRSFKVYA